MKLFDLEMGVLEVLCQMEQDGVPVDSAAIDKLDQELLNRIRDIKSEVYAVAGAEFNLDSTIQKGKFVYEIRGHKPRNFTSTGKPATDAESLQAFASDPLVKKLLDYSDIRSKHSTFVHGLREQIIDGHLYPDFVQYGTVTGRFSCRAPNLQNIPRAADSEIGNAIRGLFVAGPGEKMVVADYSQVEYRILASLSNETGLISALRAGHDAHTATAALIFATTPDKVEQTQRTIAKNVNFAMVYGAGPKKVASMCGITQTRAREILDTTRTNLPAVQKYMRQVLREARTQSPPRVKTIFGRHRRVPELMHPDAWERGKAERQAFNSVIQGSAADVAKIALVKLFAAGPSGMKIRLQVHDEFVITVPEDKVEQTKQFMEDTMVGVGEQLSLAVPLKVDAKICDRWSEGK